jgi:acyl-CoA synthetase (AMP-forming)/AMP-acid ligase II
MTNQERPPVVLSGPPLAGSVDLANVLDPGLESKPDDVALVSAEGRWTWRELERASRRCAANLLGLGLRQGDRVASLMPNRTALLVHYLACMRAGLVALPLNYRYMPPEIDHALEVGEAAVLLAHAERDAEVAASKRAPGLPFGVIRYGGAEGRGPSFAALLEGDAPANELPAPAPSDPAVIFFTSGSTGPPKGVTHSFESFGAIVASSAGGLGLTPEDVVLPASSASHIGAFAVSFAGFAAGAAVVLPRAFDGDEVLPLLREHRPSVLKMLPAALISLVRDHAARPDDFATLRMCMSGGDKVPAELEREFTELAGLAVNEAYGMSEIGIATINPPSGPNKIGSIGTLNPGYEAAIRPDGGGDAATASDGRLWVRSPCLATGYWGNSEATAQAIVDGWLDTGDVMRADDDGYLWFEGRKKQIIVHDGSNICPQDVEEALLEHPAVASAGVIGVHDLMHGEDVRAYVTLADGSAPPTGQELIRFARARVGYKAPEEVVVLEEMPLNPTGKVDRASLKRMAEERAGA